MTTEDTLAYYTAPGPLTEAGPHEAALQAHPASLPALFEAVQGLLIHDHCRAGEADPDSFGLTGRGQSGMWWIAGDLVRDVAALAGMELLPWDVRGAMPGPDDPVDDELLELFDELAAITAEPDTAAQARGHHDRDARLRVPEQVFNHLRQAHEPVITPA